MLLSTMMTFNFYLVLGHFTIFGNQTFLNYGSNQSKEEKKSSCVGALKLLWLGLPLEPHSYDLPLEIIKASVF